VRSNLLRTNAVQAVPLPLNPGTNTIQIAVVNTGATSPNSICFQVGAIQTVENVVSGNCISLAAGQQFVTTFGFPQIAFCMTNPIRFPCTTQAYPESAQHILESKGIPPQPITQPLKLNKLGNQVPLIGYPLLLTIDRPRATNRRRNSTNAYLPCLPGVQQLDEYPPAVILENAGSAHIKCIVSGDNLGAGQSLGTQIN
jgi:Deoxyribonuclease NucA/NucB